MKKQPINDRINEQAPFRVYLGGSKLGAYYIQILARSGGNPPRGSTVTGLRIVRSKS